MELIDILLIILLIIASILGIYLIKLVIRLFATIDMVENKLEELDKRLIPLIEDLQEMADAGNYVAHVAKEQAEGFEKIRNIVKEKLGMVHGQTGKLSPESNALNLVTNLKAIIKGTSTFINELKK